MITTIPALSSASLLISLHPLHSTPLPSPAALCELYIPLISLLSSRYLLSSRITIVTLAAHLWTLNRLHHATHMKPKSMHPDEHAYLIISNRSSSICLFRARIGGMPWIKRTKKVSKLVPCKCEPIRLRVTSLERVVPGRERVSCLKIKGGRKRAVRRGWRREWDDKKFLWLIESFCGP